METHFMQWHESLHGVKLFFGTSEFTNDYWWNCLFASFKLKKITGLVRDLLT